MNWLKTPHDDGDGFYWQSDHGGMRANVDLAPWLNTEKPWAAEVTTGQSFITLPQSRTASEAKAKVRKHLLATAKRLTAWGAA